MTVTPGRGAPPPPIELHGGAASAGSRLAATRVDVPDALVERLRGVCSNVTTEAGVLAEASRDWWPLAMTWALSGEVASLAAVVATPADAAEVAAVLTACNEARVPVTA